MTVPAEPSRASGQRPARRDLLARLAALLTGTAAGTLVPATGRGQGRPLVSSRGLAAIRRAQPRVEFALRERGLRLGAPLYLRVRKRERVLETWLEGEPGGRYRAGRTYRICGTLADRLGPRTSAREQRVPEGFYGIARTALDATGPAGLAMRLDWPNAVDRAQGWSTGGGRAGSISTVLVSGGCAGAPHLGFTDTDFDELFTLVYAALAFGQASVPLHVFPHALGRLDRIGLPEDGSGRVWQAMAPAWDAFARTGRPPRTGVRGGLPVLLDASPSQ